MNRRDFLRVGAGVVVVRMAWPVREWWLPDDADAREDRNREAFRQRLKQLCEEGYEIEGCRLSPVREGRRFVTVWVAKGAPIEFWQQWL